MADAAVAQPAVLTRLADEVSGLRIDVQALTQGLMLMVETQAAQSEMLQQLLEAAADGPVENPMEELLRHMTAALDQLTAVTLGNQREVARLGQRMAAAIIRGAGAPTAAAADVEEE